MLRWGSVFMPVFGGGWVWLLALLCKQQPLGRLEFACEKCFCYNKEGPFQTEMNDPVGRGGGYLAAALCTEQCNRSCQNIGIHPVSICSGLYIPEKAAPPIHTKSYCFKHHKAENRTQIFIFLSFNSTVFCPLCQQWLETVLHPS